RAIDPAHLHGISKRVHGGLRELIGDEDDRASVLAHEQLLIMCVCVRSDPARPRRKRWAHTGSLAWTRPSYPRAHPAGVNGPLRAQLRAVLDDERPRPPRPFGEIGRASCRAPVCIPTG